MKLTYFAVPLVCSTLLVGCGGGGSGSDDGGSEPPSKPKPTPIVTVSKSSLALNEGEQKSVPITANDLAKLSVTSSSNNATALIKGDNLVITASNVDRPVTLTLSVKGTLKERKKTETLTLYIKNVSANDLVSHAESALDERDNLLQLADDRRLYEFFVDFAYLGGAITRSEKDGYLAKFEAEDSLYFGELKSQMTAFESAKDDYSKGKIADSELQTELEQTESVLRNHAAYGQGKLNDIHSFSEVVAPEFVAPDMAFDAESGLYSRFLSNEVFGGYLNGEYHIDDAFSGLSSLVRLSPTDSALCEGV